jgi:two-component system, OmpR family, sensor kinase
MRRLTLRARLSIIAVALVAVGLLATGVATRYALRSFLVDRLDQQFQPAVDPVMHYFARGDSDDGARRQVYGALPPDSYAAVVSADGQIMQTQFFGRGNPPDHLDSIAGEAPIGISSDDGYRIDVISAADAGGGGPGPSIDPTARLVMAVPLADVDSTLNRLTALELLIGLAVAAVVALLAYAIVRREFQPLERMEATADAIAAGDLSRRVDDADPATEVGRLGVALNSMLGQIEQAFAERQASENRLRRFVADASHELKTPLTSVRGFAELFRRGAAGRPEDLALAMRRIESEAQRMGVLVDDLLDLARLDQGRPFAREQVDLGRLLGELVDDHQLLHPDHPISLHTNGAVSVPGDELRLRQAVANLLSNARLHTPAGTAVDVRLRSADARALIEVADQGPGIPAAEAGRVFERFFRADPSRARASGGTGLGLSIVAAIVEAHGGTVEVESEPGLGATFRIALPV